ncbi:hypothetical protein [Sulfurimonas sp.]|uniref:hypothetical protein n=1 Tax=Sulfurimonas sp. TaxID=2022749 RepID=UPI0025EFC02B|nr:hypothetical protein [Sulfurimonas sp.]
MPKIPDYINGVQVIAPSTANLDVDSGLIKALKQCITSSISNYVLESIYISSAHDSHKYPSRHMQGKGKAVDISRINGLRMSVYYTQDSKVAAITNAIQTRFESYPGRRENFGPFFKKKFGDDYVISEHGDHIHLSIN